MANETTIKSERPVFTAEQKEAWAKAKLLLKSLIGNDRELSRYRALHIAMSELRGRYRTHKGPIETVSKKPGKAQEKKSLDTYHQIRERADEWIKYFDDPGSKKLFIVVDDQLSDSQKAVQSAHAVAQFQKEYPLAPWTNGTLVLLTLNRADNRCAPDLEALWSRHSYNFDYKTRWIEPDMDNSLTAIALIDDFIDINHRVRGIKLL